MGFVLKLFNCKSVICSTGLRPIVNLERYLQCRKWTWPVKWSNLKIQFKTVTFKIGKYRLIFSYVLVIM